MLLSGGSDSVLSVPAGAGAAVVPELLTAAGAALSLMMTSGLVSLPQAVISREAQSTAGKSLIFIVFSFSLKDKYYPIYSNILWLQSQGKCESEQ